MATRHHNISGEVTQVLLAAGDGINVKSISIVNTHADTPCTADLYIERSGVGKFYIVKNLTLPVGATLILEGNDVKFNNSALQFGLFIKLTKTLSETPSVDVIIS